MSVSRKLEYAAIEDLYLDPKNPRLGRTLADANLPQDSVLDAMQGWDLEELAVSFLENGYWPQEAVIVAEEELDGVRRLIVLEGNRRIAALKTMDQAFSGSFARRAWRSIVADRSRPAELFDQVPYLLADHRSDVDAFLGFRHVTGIKQWAPAEKAQYISKLIDERGMTYVEVMRAIGSKTEAVRRNYVAYRVLVQLDDLDVVPAESVEERFSVMFLSLREAPVREFLGIVITDDPAQVKNPVSMDRYERLANYAIWLFGTEKRAPLFSDSRRMSDFAKVLKSDDAVEYLMTQQRPDFELAVRKAGVDEDEVVSHVETSTDEAELALGRIHLYRESDDLRRAMKRFKASAEELISRYFDGRS